ncbi:uncharacterized protein LOC122004343 [Zingiber officinale]|uniref:uncharacterized protein LOC122004343 n=1 Tax=Zingiber officinale TaxID=94328 RepID=UPI001C4C6417|nr:uncharacterized protein LOC122004343 [Zingiber officinale]
MVIELVQKFSELGLVEQGQTERGILLSMVAQLPIVERIKEAQATDQHLQFLYSRIIPGQQTGFSCNESRILYFQGRLCAPKSPSMKEDLLQEAHQSRFTIHPSGTHMYRDLRHSYWWTGMKKDIVNFVARCLVYQQVKAEHQRSPTLWEEVGESQILGPQSLHRDAEMVRTIRRRLSEAKDRQKSYADWRRRPLEFSVGDHPDISYEEIPVRILDRKERQLWNKTIRLVKVGWRHHSDKEATWELEDKMRASYPHLFTEGNKGRLDDD